MGKRDSRIDAYIAKSADFAKPILKYLRELVHDACPEAEETLKWGFPHFMHKGMLCGFAAFKQHCTFGFWKGKLIFGSAAKQGEAMGHFGRITSFGDLPAKKVLIGHIKEAVRLNEEGAKVPGRTGPKKKRPLHIPPYFKTALARNKKALATFEQFSPSHKREYVEWITEAKTDETRQRRLQTALEWMSDGKPRHWKYVKCG